MALAVIIVLQALALTPLTEISLTKPEGDAFVATLRGALDKLKLEGARPRVVHLLGASDVEDAVDWSPLCEGTEVPALVLIGPQVIERPPDGGCVHTVKGLYSNGTVHKALGATLATPDVIMLHNADLYTCPWRRTLAEVSTRAHGCHHAFYGTTATTTQ